MDRKSLSTLMALTIALSLVGISYSAWSDQIHIVGEVKMAHVTMTIISEKVLTSREVERYSEITYTRSEDGHYLSITCDNLRGCWFVWVGLVLQNQGTIPANLKAPEYYFEGPDGFEDYFEVEDYFYGPYPEETGFGSLEVWGRVKVSEDGPLKPDGNVTFAEPQSTPPFKTEPGEKCVVWIWIHCLDTPPDSNGETVTLYIRIMDDMAI